MPRHDVLDGEHEYRVHCKPAWSQCTNVALDLREVDQLRIRLGRTEQAERVQIGPVVAHRTKGVWLEPLKISLLLVRRDI